MKCFPHGPYSVCDMSPAPERCFIFSGSQHTEPLSPLPRQKDDFQGQACVYLSARGEMPQALESLQWKARSEVLPFQGIECHKDKAQEEHLDKSLPSASNKPSAIGQYIVIKWSSDIVKVKGWRWLTQASSQAHHMVPHTSLGMIPACITLSTAGCNSKLNGLIHGLTMELVMGSLCLSQASHSNV